MTSPRPHTGDDTFVAIDDVLATLAQRRGVWLGDDIATITLIGSFTQQAQRFLLQLVPDARSSGHSWHEIADALGTGVDDAQRRFPPDSPHRRRTPGARSMTGAP